MIPQNLLILCVRKCVLGKLLDQRLKQNHHEIGAEEEQIQVCMPLAYPPSHYFMGQP